MILFNAGQKPTNNNGSAVVLTLKEEYHTHVGIRTIVSPADLDFSRNSRK